MELPNPCGGDELEHSFREASLGSLVRFELRSWLGRHFLTRGPPAVSGGPRLLNLGSGSAMLDGWVNADVFLLRWWRRPASYWAVDLRYPLKCEPNFWDGVTCEHAIEHLYPHHACRLFAEVFRILKPGGWFRVSVPDLAKYVRYYQGQPADERFARWLPRAAAVRSLSQGWGHRSLWDAQLLGLSLERAGFSPVREVDFRQGADARLAVDRPDRQWESLYIEAMKPGVAVSAA